MLAMRVRLRCIMYRSCAVMAALLNPWQCILVVESSVSDANKDRSCDNATAAECMIRGCIVKWHSGTLHTQGAGYYDVFIMVHQPRQCCIRHTHLHAWHSVLNAGGGLNLEVSLNGDGAVICLMGSTHE